MFFFINVTFGLFSGLLNQFPAGPGSGLYFRVPAGFRPDLAGPLTTQRQGAMTPKPVVKLVFCNDILV